MKSISLSLQIHSPFRFKKYRFFDVGNDSYYYDDFENDKKTRLAAENLYLPANEVLIGLLKKYKGLFKVAFSISGTALDQFYLYAPEVLESFQRMSDIGGVEFLGETYSHSLASLFDKNEFIRQSNAHIKKIEDLFNQTPSVYKNTEMIYSDNIGELVALMGFKSVLTEGTKQVLGWRSPNYLYCHPSEHELKLLFNNDRMSDDLISKFGNPDRERWQNITSKCVSALKSLPYQEKLINLFFDYEKVTKGQNKGTGILNFLKFFPSSVLELTDYRFMNPGEISNSYSPVSEISIPKPVSGAGNEASVISAWLGNELQEEALRKLYSVNDKIENCHNTDLLRDWQCLQSIDHLYYMSSKFFSNQGDSTMKNPYNNPYEAFMNYMNILDDFEMRLNDASKATFRRFNYMKSRELVKD